MLSTSISPLYQPEQSLLPGSTIPWKSARCHLVLPAHFNLRSLLGRVVYFAKLLRMFLLIPPLARRFCGHSKDTHHDDSKPRRATGDIISWETLGNHRGYIVVDRRAQRGRLWVVEFEVYLPTPTSPLLLHDH